MTSQGRQLAILVGGNFFLTLGFSIVMPILPYYSNSMGASALDLGLLMAAYSVMQFIVTPFWGHMSDRLGRIAGGLAYDINVYLPYLISGILSAAGAVAILLANRRKRKS